MREVESALREYRIQTVYQPIVALATGRLVGVEALCRIVMPGGAVRPAADFNLADSDAQIAYELTRTILRRVTGDMARWRETGCDPGFRSEEHTSELQSLMRISYAVFCLKKKKYKIITN